MKRLGISLYPEKAGFKETESYLNVAKENSFKRIFINLLEIKNDDEGNEKIEKYRKILNYAKDMGFEVIVDVNKDFYKEFKLDGTEINYFMKLGATGIRFDEPFDGKVEAKISLNKNNFKVELNASSGTELFEKIINYGGNPDNLIACHNFYPLRYTGLDKDRFIELSSKYRAWGIKVAAFVTLPENKKNIGPWNINEGMPTIEEHRDANLEKQVIELLASDLVDDVIISQQGNIKYLKEVKNAMDKYLAIKSKRELEIEIEKSDLNNLETEMIFKSKNELFNRVDYNSSFIRSTLSRIQYKDEAIEPKNSNHKLKKGDVIILNNKNGRYKGEVHILLKDIDDTNEGKRNLIGKVPSSEWHKFLFLKDGLKFKFIDKKEKN